MPEDHEVLGVGPRDKGNTQNTPDYDTIIYLDVSNTDKTIRVHGGPSTRQMINVTLERLDHFLEHLSIFVKSIQMSHNTFQLISRRIILISLEEGLYAQVVRIFRKGKEEFVSRTVCKIGALV